MEQAIEKLTTEIEKEANPYVKFIGEFLINQVENNPATAEKIMADDKTIVGSLKAMAEKAREVAVNGMAMLTDEEGFKIVLDYFGIEQSEPVVSKIEEEKVQEDFKPKKEKKARPKATKEKLDAPDGQLDIFDVLGDAG